MKSGARACLRPRFDLKRTDALKWHPDIEFVHDVIDGIEFGRAMGFRGDRALPTARLHEPTCSPGPPAYAA